MQINTGPSGCLEMQNKLLDMLIAGFIFRDDDIPYDAYTNAPVGAWNGGARLIYIGMHSRVLYEQYWEISTGMTLRHEYGHNHKPTTDEGVANTYMGKCTAGSSDAPGPAGPPLE